MDDAGVIVAVSGSQDTSVMIVKSLISVYEHAKLEKDDTPARLLCDAIFEYKRKLVERTYGTFENLKKSMNDDGLKCELMIAYYFKKQQQVHTAEFEFGPPIHRPHPYWAMGIGRHVTNYLLRQTDVAKMTSQEAVFTAIHVIREVKEAVQGCGGPTRIAIVGPGNQPEKLSLESVQERELLVDQLYAKEKEAADAMKTAISKAAMEYQAPGWSYPAED
jgi:20S proteasome alpha/beta subunit